MKIGWISLGCPKNLVDTEFMIGLMIKYGNELTLNPREADVLVINTCCFIQPATQESLDMIVEYSQYKKEKCRLLVVTGCLAQRYGRRLSRLLPEVDLWVGTGEYYKLPELVNSAVEGKESGDRFYLDKPGWLPESGIERVLSTPPYMAYVKIAEGCDHHCRFCVIPRLRGPYRSRPSEEIEKEVKNLVAGGVKEIILVAQDTTAYGIDLPGNSSLPRLLSILERIKGDFWLRLLYTYPDGISSEFLKVFRDSGRLCRYLDLPLQHVSEKILRAMGRPSAPEGISQLPAMIREQIPGMTLRTTFILGYPGETEEDFARLAAFLDRARFDWVGAFPYYREEGTPAARIKPQVHPSTRKKRVKKLLSKQEKISQERNSALCGKKLRVLVEKKYGHGWNGRSYREAPEIDGLVKISPCAAEVNPGDFITVEVTGAGAYEIYAKIT